MKKGKVKMQLDNIDVKVLKENFDDKIISQLDNQNVNKIYNYLIDLGVYYAKDIFVSQANLFLLDYDLFVKKFEKLKQKLGDNYIDLLGEDCSLINIMYEDN